MPRSCTRTSRAAADAVANAGSRARRQLDDVFLKAMAKQPTERYATATALVAACRRAVAQLDAAQLGRAPAFAPPDEASDAPDRHAGGSAESAADVGAGPAGEPMFAPVRPSGGAAGGAPTAAEIPRPVADGPPAVREARTPAAIAAAVCVALLVLVAPIAGYALGGSDRPAVQTTARSAALTLVHGAEWSPSRTGIEGLDLEQALTLRRADGLKLAAGRLKSYPSGFDPAPAALRARTAAAGDTATIRLGAAAAVRHRASLRAGDRLWLALAPDDRGWIAIACEGPGADRPAACPAVARSMRRRGAVAVAPGPDRRVAAMIDAALRELNDTRRGATPDLRVRLIATRAKAAKQLALAESTAARKLSAAGARPQERRLVDALSATLRTQSRQLERLGTAAGKRRRKDYNLARALAKGSERRLRLAMGRLRAIGYGR